MKKKKLKLMFDCKYVDFTLLQKFIKVKSQLIQYQIIK